MAALDLLIVICLVFCHENNNINFDKRFFFEFRKIELALNSTERIKMREKKQNQTQFAIAISEIFAIFIE